MSADPRAVLSRTARPPEATVAYGELPDQVADLRAPAGPGPARPLVVVVHGGFWRPEYDRRHTDSLAAGLAALGHPVAQLAYRRISRPGGGWADTSTDVRTGIAALPRLAAEALPGRVAPGAPVLVGHSAGGQLALYAAATTPEAVAGVLALAPVSDLVAAYRWNLDSGAVAAFLGGGPDDVPDRYAAADPRMLVPIRTRTVVVHGTLDQQVPVEMSRDFVTAGRLADAPITLTELPRCEHFGVIDPESAAWPQVTDALRTLVEDHWALTERRGPGRTPGGR